MLPNRATHHIWYIAAHEKASVTHENTDIHSFMHSINIKLLESDFSIYIYKFNLRVIFIVCPTNQFPSIFIVCPTNQFPSSILFRISKKLKPCSRNVIKTAINVRTNTKGNSKSHKDLAFSSALNERLSFFIICFTC